MKLNAEKMNAAVGNACMTYKILSERTGISVCTLARIKNGHQNPRPATVGKIAKALNVKVEDLVEQCCNTDQAKSEAMKSRMKG